jgi:chromosome partitioning protein
LSNIIKVYYFKTGFKKLSCILTVASKKGGSAKTTTSVNLSACLAQKGKRVLLVDLDSQGHATTSLGHSPYKNDSNLFELFTKDEMSARDILCDANCFDLKLLPAGYRMENISNILLDIKGSGYILKEKLEELKNDFDFIIIDTPATINIMTINGLVAADKVIIPMQQHFLSMDSLAQIIKFIGKIKNMANSQLEILGIVPTIVELSTTHNRQVLQEILGHFGQKLFNTKIHKDIKLAEAPSYGQPINLYAPQSRGAEDYKSLAEEVLSYEKV